MSGHADYTASLMAHQSIVSRDTCGHKPRGERLNCSPGIPIAAEK